MLDVLIAGAGPAGAIAARQLALAGARVLLVDRDTFPRHKLCGDTLNPGAVRLLSTLGLSGGVLDAAVPLVGMRVTGPGAVVDARYADGRTGVAITRRALDAWLLDQAIAAGARFESGLVADGALTEGEGRDLHVRGLSLRNAAGTVTRVPALVTIAADGRRSAVARSVGLTTVPEQPRRWAYGTYFSGARGREQVWIDATGTEQTPTGALGEMHVRPGWYCGVAPVSDDLVNVCVVTDRREGADDPLGLIRAHLARDPELRERFAHAETVAPVSVLGPLAVDARSAGVPGLFLAGDAAGFVDPITGDGLNLAMQGAVLAADAAMHVLKSGDWHGAVERLKTRRTEMLGTKLRFNRAIRSLTSSPLAVRAAGVAAIAVPALIRRLIIRAGDAA